MERKAEFTVPARATGGESPSWQSPEPEEKACAAVRQWENVTLNPTLDSSLPEVSLLRKSDLE